MQTRSWWVGEVRRWGASGTSARTFSESKPYSPKTLQWWAAKLRREQIEKSEPIAIVPVVRVAAERRPGEIWIEIRGARIRMSRGFEASLLRDVVDALGGAP